MRQAGRYMPQYRELRSRVSNFLELCKNVELAVEVSLLPLRLLGVDGIIIFSDILVPLEALGVLLEFVEGEGPKLHWSGDVKDLKPYNPEENAYVFEIIRKVKEIQDEVPVIGFGGAPFTLASYLIEGGASKDFRKTKLFMWEKEREFKKLMEVLTETQIAYLKEQIKAGADVVQVFDSWANYLSAEDYEEFVFPFVNYLISELKDFSDVPIIYFFRGSCAFIDIVADTRADCLSVDWTLSIPEAMKLYDKAFQGNLEPTVLYSSKEVIREKTLSLLRSIPKKTGYVFNLGHGLAPDMEMDKVKFLVDTVKSYRF